MRATLVAAAFLLPLALAPDGFAQSGVGATPGLSAPGETGPTLIQTGTITYLDSATMNFVLRVNGMARRFWVTRTTLFGGRPGASFFDLRRGQKIEVEFHAVGRIDIADVVVF